MSNKLADLLTLVEARRDGDPHDGDAAITYRGVVDPVFTIGPKVHGGSLQMVVAHAAREAVSALVVAGAQPGTAAATAGEMIPVAISSDYLSAPEPAEVDLEVRVRKVGRTVAVLGVDARQNGRTMVSSSVTMARPDSGTPHHSGRSPLDDTAAEPPADGIAIDTSPIAEVIHLGPALDLVLDPQTFPMVRGETGEPVVRGWCRPKGGVDPTTDFAVLVCDISPPVVMNLAIFGWAPTVQLTTYVRRAPAPGWLRFAASSVEVGPGMFEEDHLVVDSTGTVVAQSRQLALIPARQ